MTDDSKRQHAHQLHQNGQLTEAEHCYRALLKEQKNDIELLHALAVVLAKQDKCSAAIKTIHRALALAPTEYALHNSLGNIHARNNDLTAAIQAYQQAITQQPNYAVAYNNLGNCYRRNQQQTEALAAFDQAIAHAPQFTDATFNRALLLIEQESWAAAIAALEKTLSLRENHLGAISQLAELYRDQQNNKKAIEYYQKRIALEPTHTDSYYGLGECHLALNNIADALAALKKTMIMEADHPTVYQSLGNAELANNDPSKALNYYFRQLDINPLPDTYYNIGVILMQQNRHKEATQYLEHSLTLSPGLLSAHVNLGALYLKMQHIEKAIQHYQAALTLTPDDEEIRHILAALTNDSIPDAAPRAYLSNLFDQYAHYYDKHLTQALQYTAHQALYQQITAHWPTDTPATILDLGCGTGLCGELLKRFARQLIGIDVSENMLAVAQSRTVYDVLECMDVHTALNTFHDIDLIVAGDVFSYIGKLDDIHHAAYAALTTGGLFSYTVEKTFEAPFVLQQTIRYAHAKTYIECVANQAGFDIITMDQIELRKQKNTPVEGYCVTLKKKDN